MLSAKTIDFRPFTVLQSNVSHFYGPFFGGVVQIVGMSRGFPCSLRPFPTPVFASKTAGFGRQNGIFQTKKPLAGPSWGPAAGGLARFARSLVCCLVVVVAGVIGVLGCCCEWWWW